MSYSEEQVKYGLPGEEKLYTQSEADAYAKKCVDHDRKRFAFEKCADGYSPKKVASVLGQLAVETPEEKEAFDAIGKDEWDGCWLKNGDKPEWDGEGLPPVGTECDILHQERDDIVIGRGKIYHIDGSKVFILSDFIKNYPEESTIKAFDSSLNLYVMWINDGDVRFRKLETTQQREDRERLEAAYDLFVEWQLDEQTPIDTIRDFESFSKDKATTSDWLRVVDKTNCRKG